MKPSLRLIGVIAALLTVFIGTAADSNISSNTSVSENTIKIIEVNSKAYEYVEEQEDTKVLATTYVESTVEASTEEVITKEEEPVVVYKDMTMDQLVEKLNKSLNSNIAGYGSLFASYAIEKNVDPYMAVSIVLLETGCKWGCSTLVKECNNVGGQHGGPEVCGDGPYGKFATLEDGIKAFIDNLSKNYIDLGLTTPELINPKYAASKQWAEKVRRYMVEIENN